MSRHVLLLKKYKDYAVPIALALGLIATTDKSEVDKCDLIAHVPIHVDKRKVRGFDQAEEIAIILSTLLNKPCSNALVKTQNIELHSAGGLMDRIVRVKGLYSCDEAFHGERILLVDDIATTGLDLAECAKILHEKGTSTVNGLVGGRTVFRI
jgi:predicted amidophosphoribosyltransferase